MCAIITGCELSQTNSSSLPILIPASIGNSANCSSQDIVAEQLTNVRNILHTQFGTNISSSNLSCTCGSDDPSWNRVIYLNMSDPNHSCPSNWNLVTTPVRGCGRVSSTGASCDSAIFQVTNHTYSKVCGQINAFQRGISGAFYNSIVSSARNLERSYVSGVSLTHGQAGSRQHIWTFAGSINEDPLNPNLTLNHKCSCTDANTAWNYEVPSYVGSDYFCETGKKTALVQSNDMIYVDDPLWNGRGCGPASTCCSFNSPPWFCKSLPQPTSDDLEIRLCYTSAAQYEDKLISLIDIYVQ